LIKLFTIVFQLVTLHDPGGHVVEVNPTSITSLREEHDGGKHFPKHAKCLINLADGKFIAVVETCEEVRSKIIGGQNAK
jgi:hypothetical protein